MQDVPVGALATDQTLSEGDLELLDRAQRGDKQSLRAACNRFQTPLAALLLHSTGDWERAATEVEPLLERLCRELLVGQIVATDWAARATELAAQQDVSDLTPRDNGSGLEGLGSIPRVVKRRALRALLPQLKLPELTALLLRYLEQRRPEEMAGLVAPTAAEAAACLVRAHETLQSELDRLTVSREASHEL
jgi:hypothetical protein